MNNQGHELGIFNKFHNCLAIQGSDKYIGAHLFARSVPSDKANFAPVLDVTIQRRGSSQSTIFHSLVEPTSDYVTYLRERDQSIWTPVDFEAARAIMCALKCFEKLKSTTQYYSETFELGKVIPSNAQPIAVPESQYVITASVKKSKTPPKEYKEEGATERSDYADGKNYKYPINTPEHVRAAISYFAKPKNYGEYQPAERASIAKKIISAAKKHDIQISDEWKDKFIKKSAENLKFLVKDLIKKGCDKTEIMDVIKKSIDNKRHALTLPSAIVKQHSEASALEWEVVGYTNHDLNSDRDHSKDNLTVKDTIL